MFYCTPKIALLLVLLILKISYIYDQILRGVLGQGKISVPCSAHHVIFFFLLKVFTVRVKVYTICYLFK